MSNLASVALLGPGAIGTTIAAVLHEAGRKPVLCGRTAHQRLILRRDDGETRGGCVGMVTRQTAPDATRYAASEENSRGSRRNPLRG